ncbi:asparaginase [Halogeometricum limi]|uniref:L-asparaginase n=1 Tax=Halogeometricum limi TaxID=555875 RepID=A0A1I6IBZ7_9EURY|nr:asparaginase [Halogeometricum limi]SFR64228.1 L-asparaginase [Halogeometricum limi]
MTVVVVSTGGTIASTESEGGDAEPELTGDALVAAVPGLNSVADVRTHDFSNVPSPYFTVEQMHELAEVVRSYDEDDEVSGVVVTQGTDILEESAYFVDCCYGGDTPVVFTGAMRNPSLAGADGPANLLASVRAASDERFRETSQNTAVVFDDRLHAPADVTKMHSSNVDTFRSPEFGPLATIDEDRVVWRHHPAEPTPTFDVDPDRLTNDVVAAFATADMTDAVIRAAADSAAFCLAATGAGHVPPGIIPALESLRDGDVPIVATTRCPEGRLARETYGFRGSEATLRELGCYYSDQNLQKTRVRTIVAHAADAFDEAFERP